MDPSLVIDTPLILGTNGDEAPLLIYITKLRELNSPTPGVTPLCDVHPTVVGYKVGISLPQTIESFYFCVLL